MQTELDEEKRKRKDAETQLLESKLLNKDLQVESARSEKRLRELQKLVEKSERNNIKLQEELERLGSKYSEEAASRQDYERMFIQERDVHEQVDFSDLGRKRSRKNYPRITKED